MAGLAKARSMQIASAMKQILQIASRHRGHSGSPYELFVKMGNGATQGRCHKHRSKEGLVEVCSPALVVELLNGLRHRLASWVGHDEPTIVLQTRVR